MATTVILDVPFNFANVIVLPLLFGLGVSSGINMAGARTTARVGFAAYHFDTESRAVQRAHGDRLIRLARPFDTSRDG